jgi:hypothetical protein
MTDPDAEIDMKLQLAQFLEWLAHNVDDGEYEYYEEDYGCEEKEIEIILKSNGESTDSSSGSDSDQSPDRVVPKTCEQGIMAVETFAKPQVHLA